MEWYSVLMWSVIGLLTAVYLYFKKKFSYWKDRGVAFVEPIIPFGNLPMRDENMRNIMAKVYKKRDGTPFVGAYIFAQPIVVATDLEFVQNVLVKDFSNFHERGMYTNEKDDPLSAHMFALDGQKWRTLRAKLSPTFTSGKMKFMYPTVVEVAERFKDSMSEILETQQIVEVKDILARFTTDVIGTCAFGIECNSLKDPNVEFRRYGRKTFDEPHLNTMGHLFTMFFPKLARFMGVKLTSPDIIKFFMGIVRETITFREKNNVRRNDFMDLLIQLKNNEALEGEVVKEGGKLSIEEVAAQAFLFFLAGFETSSTTMTFAFYELALNQDIQEKAREEINRVLSKHNGELTYEALMEITYVDQIISETLRKYPPVVTINRQCVEDYKVPNSTRTIKKGTAIFIPAYEIQHDPAVFTNPEVFDPERFTAENIKSRHAMSFLSFGLGPRNCIGLRFGRLQARVGLVTLLKNFRFKPSLKTPIPMVFSIPSHILSPVGGMHLKIEKIA